MRMRRSVITTSLTALRMVIEMSLGKLRMERVQKSSKRGTGTASLHIAKGKLEESKKNFKTKLSSTYATLCTFYPDVPS